MNELTITDLQNIKAIIDTAAKRGAFFGSEMSGVGQVYDKLDNFLKSATSTENAANQQE